MRSNYNKKLKKYARENRNDSTKAEIRMWCELLRRKKILGYSFLRQRPIGKYIVDFLCRKLSLVIEVDGYSHQFKYEEDKHREKALKDLGYDVLRFSDEEVMEDLENVERVIRRWIREKEGSSPSTPFKEGGQR